MRFPAPPISRSGIGLMLAAALFLIALIDGGSIVMSRLTVPDDAMAAGHEAAQAVEGLPVTQQTVVLAFEAAQGAATPRGVTVEADDFALYADGRVTLTVSRTAPTLLLQHVPGLRDLARVSSTTTVTALPFY